MKRKLKILGMILGKSFIKIDKYVIDLLNHTFLNVQLQYDLFERPIITLIIALPDTIFSSSTDSMIILHAETDRMKKRRKPVKINSKKVSITITHHYD